jgi:hypothetical protein
MNKLLITAAGTVALSLFGLGCGASDKPASSGERPGVVVPRNGNTIDNSRSTPQASDDQVLAEIDGVKLTESQFKPILYKAKGLDVLLMIVQRNMAKAEAAKEGLTISPADIEAEKNITLQQAFPDAKEEDYEQALRQLLAQQRVSEIEFSILMEYNAYLRAVVKQATTAGITEEAVRNEFNSLYGERVIVRDIALNNLQEVAEARALLEDPEKPMPFDQVARRMSRLPSREEGGLLPPFARTSPGYNPVFVTAAFALEPGKVSTDLIQDKGFYHILKAERRIEPTVVKYEDVKESVREDLIRRRAAGLMSVKRREYGQHALRDLRIIEPAMAAEFAARVEAANPKPVEKEKLIEELDAIEKEKQAAGSTTAPAATQSTAEPTPAPGTPTHTPLEPTPAATQPATTTEAPPAAVAPTPPAATTP